MSCPDGFVLVGFDGSRNAAGAIAVGARLLPGLAARVVNVRAPPGAEPELHRRATRQDRTLDELSALMEQEGVAAAEQVAADGVAVGPGRRVGGRTACPSRAQRPGDRARPTRRGAPPAAVVVGSQGLKAPAAISRCTTARCRCWWCLRC